MPIIRWVLALSLAPLVCAQTEHNRKVADEIKTQLDAAFKAQGDIDIATRIQIALAKVTAERNEPGKSKDETLRDAEYYLHGLYGAAANDWAHVAPTVGTPVYNALKWVALRCSDAGLSGLEKWMRTQSERPVSEPGGTHWAYRGLKDGFKIIGKAQSGPRPAGHGLSLQALDAEARCKSQGDGSHVP